MEIGQHSFEDFRSDRRGGGVIEVTAFHNKPIISETTGMIGRARQGINFCYESSAKPGRSNPEARLETGGIVAQEALRLLRAPSGSLATTVGLILVE
jgi:hypothetical protein